MTERPQMRRLLWRWGRILEYCANKQREMQEFQDMIDAQAGLSVPTLTGMPQGGKAGNPTERAAIRLTELTDQYMRTIADLAEDCDIELKFKRAMDRLIKKLPGEQQKVLELRYKGGHAWVYVALRMCFSEIRAKEIEAAAVDALMPDIDILIS